MFPDDLSTIFPPLVLTFEPTVRLVEFTLKSPATEIAELAPLETVPPVDVRVRPAPAVALLIALLTVTLPVANNVAVDAEVSWSCKAVGVTFEAEALSVYQVPFIQVPVESRAVEEDTVTAEGILLVLTVSMKSLKPIAV
jgi:hypothetical protein